MISGVVIWYSRQDSKALIWCEDSGALAVALGPQSWRVPDCDIAVGDCVGLSAELHGRERIGTDIHLIASMVAPDLPKAIRPDQPNLSKKGLTLVSGDAPAMERASEVSPGGCPAGLQSPRPLRSGIPLLHLCASRD